MADLVTSGEVTTALPGLTDDQLLDLPAAITAASRAVERRCDRVLTSASHDEVHTPDRRTRRAWLRQYPVTAVARVAALPECVLTVANTSASVQRATVALAATIGTDPVHDQPTVTGITLTRISSGVSTSSTLAFSTYMTLSALAAAIVALGNGWTATVASGYGDWGTAEIDPVLGAQSAKGTGAEIRCYTEDVSSYDLDERTGKLMLSDPWSNVPWWGGSGRVRVSYTAGYTTVPGDLKRATIIVVKALLDRAQASGVFRQEILEGYSYTLSESASSGGGGGSTDEVSRLIAPYVRRRFA